MKSRQILNALDSLGLLIKENREVRVKNKELTDLLANCLLENDNLKNEKDNLVSENKELKRDVCKRDEFIDNNVESLKQKNKDLAHQKDELIQANTVLKDGIRELKAVNQLLEQGIEDLRNNIEISQAKNRQLSNKLKEVYELHALKKELQKELKEQTDISPKLEIKGGGEFKISERPLSLAQKQEDSIRKSGRGFNPR